MRIFLIVILLAAAVPTSAQNSAEAWLIPFAAAYQPQVAGFNKAFANHGMPASASRHYGWGIELRALTGSFLIGPLFFRTWDDAENSSYELRTDANGIFGEAGLKLAPASFLTIVPLLGLGGLSQSFGLRSKSSAQAPLDSLLGDLPRTASFSSGLRPAGMGALELGLILNTKAGRIGITVRGGYLYSPFTPTWHLSNDAEVSDAPVTHLGGPFYSVGLLLMPEAQNETSTQ
ncbi:MAG TPA: hypothetical protein VMH22_14315 [bacterium]|nr:hypothetical protein [bacterium]